MFRKISQSTLLSSWAIFLFSSALLLVCALQLSLGMGVEESRYIVFAQEMLRHGLTPFPLLRGAFYPDYPATHTVLIYLFSLIGHQVTALTAILPSLLASALTLTFIYRIGAIYSREWGLYGVLFALATFEFLLLARAPSPDPFVALITTVCFYYAYKNAGWRMLLLLPVGFLFRGPIGLVIPALVLCTVYVIEKKYRQTFYAVLSSFALLTVCIVCQLWIAQQIGGDAFTKRVFFMEVAGRLTQLGHKAFYYYFAYGFANLALAFPVAILSVIAHQKALRQITTDGEVHLLKHLLGWTLIVLLALSFPEEKHFRYVLSATPALALLAAYVFVSAQSTPLLNRTRRILLTGSRFFPLCIFIVVSVIGIISRYFNYPLTIHYPVTLLIFAVLTITAVFIQRSLLIFTLGVATFLAAFITIGQPLAEQYVTSVQPLIQTVDHLRATDQKIVFYHVDTDREGLKFMALLNQTTTLPFLTTPTELEQFTHPAVFISGKKFYDALPAALKSRFAVISQETCARGDWVIFRKNL